MRWRIHETLLMLGPTPFVAASWLHGATATPLRSFDFLAAVASSSGFTIGALVIRHRPRLGSCLTAGGGAGFIALLAGTVLYSPALTLVVSLTALSGLFWLLFRSSPWGRRRAETRASPARSARTSAAAAVVFWIVGLLLDIHAERWILHVSLGLTFAVPVVLAAIWLWRNARRSPSRAALLAIACVLSAVGIATQRVDAWHASGWTVAIPAAMLLCIPLEEHVRRVRVSWWEPLISSPEHLLASTFLLLCVGGTVVLSIPLCSTGPVSLDLVDVAFTAVSAVCITGLIVVDTPVDFTLTGQAVILVLIQLGGLGIMVFSTAAMRLLGRRLSLRHERSVSGLLGPQHPGTLFGTVRRLLVVTLATELAGTLALLVPFLHHGDSFARALWRALFTSVSAFCNAGFALQSDSLVPYQHDPFILHVVAALIILGGLSPFVVLALPGLVRRGGPPVPPRMRIIVMTTSMLLVSGFLFFLVVEWQTTLKDLSFWDRVHNAWFQSVTPRTAGFNSLPIDEMRPVTRSVMLIMMFIGGSPAGTAGGIKTTTAAILILAVVAAIRGRWVVTAYGRRISHKTVYKSAAIVTVGAASVVAFFIALQLTQDMPTDVAFFETISALGTVGLSIGGTEQLDGVGKALVIVCMFVGRIGPLTLFIFLSYRTQHTPWHWPEEEVDVG